MKTIVHRKIRSHVLALGLVGAMVCPALSGSLEFLEKEHSFSAQLDNKVLWTCHHDPAEGKPYFHPLSSVDGTMFTDLRPGDHVWHRALWFSWKTVNGVNYWEEDSKTGKSQGETRMVSVKRAVSNEKQVRFDFVIEYAPAGSAAAVMKENRCVKLSAPDESGRYQIDWSSAFEALDKDVVLDRTPIPGQPDGQSYGGYAGLSLRMNGSVKQGTFLNSNGLAGEDANRKPALWMIFDVPQGGNILLMDHPSNLNHPSPWYIFASMPFVSPAVIHEAPHTIKAGEVLKLKYRLVVGSGSITKDAADKEWQAWSQQDKS